MTVYTAPAPPPLPQDATQPYATLPPKQQEMYEDVLAHFVTEDYALPGAKEGKGALMEEEKFWLVSTTFRTHLGEVWRAVRSSLGVVRNTNGVVLLF